MNDKWNDEIVINNIRKRLAKRLYLVGEFVTGQAKLFCPEKTGNLKGSIDYEVNEDELECTVGTPVEYAPYVELGTQKMSAKPFLRPAIHDRSAIEKLLGG